MQMEISAEAVIGVKLRQRRHSRGLTLAALAEMGAIVAPPIPGFYNNPTLDKPLTVEDLVDSSVDRVLDLIGLPEEGARRWNGPKSR